MLTPSYLLHATEPAEEIAEELHINIMNRIIERLKNRIKRGDDYLMTALDKWQIETLQEAGFLLEDIQKEIAAATDKMVVEIAEAMEDAGVKALEYDDKIYRDAGLNPEPLTQSPQLVRILQRDYEKTVGEWKNFTGTTATATQQTFITLCDTAYHQAMTGAISIRQATREAIDQVITQGVIIEYPTGHKDTIETATTRAVRTGISQATAEIQIARMDEMDVDMVLVSSHMGARPEHAVWQGQIFRKDELEEKTKYGTVTGLCGANCRHSFGPWFEGMDNPFEKYDSKENQKQYEMDQRQRTLERRIRHTKRLLIGYQTKEDHANYERTAALLQRQNDAYNQFCEENNLKKRSDRIHIAKWDRKQAAQARAAAKQYAKDHSKTTVPQKTGTAIIYTQKEKEEFAELRAKYKSKTEVMLFGTEEELIRYDFLLQKEKIHAGEHDYFKNFKLQDISETTLNSWKNEPTVKQRDAISTYSRSGYGKMNEHLRFGNYVDKTMKAEIEELKSYLKNNQTQTTLYLSRGTNKYALNKIFGSEKWQKDPMSVVGSVFQDKGFVSTTPYEGGGFGGDVKMYIKAPKGTEGAYIKKYAASSEEKEFLLQCGTVFAVKNIIPELDKWGDTRYKVFLEVMI